MGKKRVLLIGAGQLGSRHLQGLTKVGIPLSVSIVEPHPTGNEVSRTRLNEVLPGYSMEDFRFYSSLKEIEKGRFALAIIATNSDVRQLVVNELLELTDVENILLEKVVFQSPDLFPEIMNKLTEKKIKAWVNCPRRLFPVYQEIRELIKNDPHLSMSVTGGEWGMACNSLHFIDLFVFLTGISALTVEASDLDAEILHSKREGFIEVTGRLIFGNNKGSLKVESVRKSASALSIKIISDNYEIAVNETLKEWSVSGKGNIGRIEKMPFIMPFQSELTGQVTDRILAGKEPGLVSIEDSFLQHAVLLPAVMNHLTNVNGEDYTYCPIT